MSDSLWFPGAINEQAGGASGGAFRAQIDGRSAGPRTSIVTVFIR